MRRDMDLVRELLIATADAEEPLWLTDLMEMDKIGTHSEAEVWYHVELLDAHGFIDCLIVSSDDGRIGRCRVDGLTWDGQDYLQAIRDNRVWAKAKKAISESVGSCTFEVVKFAAVETSKRMVSAALTGMF